MNLDSFSQFAITVCSASSIFFFASKGKHQRLGFICSLCGQPFWFFTSLKHGQWGITILSLWFTFNGIRGLINHPANRSQKP